ncbi:MAG: GDYXXLXY domain-containing protein [Hyphomicrobiales bacterium]|nr:GDYXXLXY domain-containing protein [Hyphomicrobiales bacterium]
MALPLRVKSRRWVLVTDAWYFREGTAPTWNKARFGEFRVGTTGQALLVGLADESLALLTPGPRN